MCGERVGIFFVDDGISVHIYSTIQCSRRGAVLEVLALQLEHSADLVADTEIPLCSTRICLLYDTLLVLQPQCPLDRPQDLHS